MTLTTLVMILIFGVFFYLMMKKGGGCCGGHDHAGHDSSEGNKDTGHTHHHMNTEAIESGSEKDPVCGMVVKDNRIEDSHLGRTFHFCSEKCKKIFNLNPHKYAGAS